MAIFGTIPSTANVVASAITGTISSLRLPAGTVVQTQVKNSLTLASTSSTSFVELHSDYRVGITPKFANSIMVINYHLPINSNGADVGTIVHFKAFKRIAGVNSEVTGFGDTFNGNLGVRTSTHGAKRYAAFDLNDADIVSLIAYDVVSSTSYTEYGFYFKRETGGTTTNYFAHSANNSASYGWMAPVTVVVQEIAA